MSKIVIAWTEEEWRVDPSTPMARRDLDERAKLVSFNAPKAAMWMNEGTKADISKAEAYANREGYRVFVYPANEEHPLERARRDILKPVRKKRR